MVEDRSLGRVAQMRWIQLYCRSFVTKPERVSPTTHICRATGEMNPDARWGSDHDRSSAANTRRSAAPSTFASTRTDTPRDSVISIRPSG